MNTQASAASSGVNGSVSYQSPVVNTILLLTKSGVSSASTYGGDVILINGSNFGPTGHKNVSVRYGPPSDRFQYSALCLPIINQSLINCSLVEGVGVDLRAFVIIGSQQSSHASVNTFAFRPPMLTNLSGEALESPSSTHGGAKITLHGDFFGPAGHTDFEVVYGGIVSAHARYRGVNCSILHQNILTCTTAPGVGARLNWRVTIGNQSTPINVNLSTSYAAPLITSIGTNATNGLLKTAGGDLIFFNGTNFGPKSKYVSDSYATFRSVSSSTFILNETLCSVTVEHVQISCITDGSNGHGKNLNFTVIIGGQSSIISRHQLSFAPPEVNSVRIAGSSSTIETRGGQTIIINGNNFGPKSTGLPNSYISATFGPNGRGFNVSKANCSVSISHTEIRCVLPASWGANLAFIVIIDEQYSRQSQKLFNCSKPTINSLSFTASSHNIDLVMNTAGGDDVVLRGENFGGLTFEDDGLIQVTYSNEVLMYTAKHCRVHIAHTGILCKHSPGIGFGHRWHVTRSGITGVQSYKTRYEQPNILSVKGRDLEVAGDMSTFVIVNGSNFGPNGSTVTARYMTFGGLHCDIFNASNCSQGVFESWCTDVMSLEKPLAVLHGIYPSMSSVYKIWQDYDQSNNSYALRLKGKLRIDYAGIYQFIYSPGSHVRFSIKLNDWKRKKSNDSVVLVSGMYDIVIEYVNDNLIPEFDAQINLNWTWIDNSTGVVTETTPIPSSNFARAYDSLGSCTMTIAHYQLLCKTQPRNTGENFLWDVTVGGQISNLSKTGITFDRPELTFIRSSSLLQTVGGGIVSFQGNNFGETGLVIKGTYGRQGIQGLKNGTGFTFQRCIVVSKGIVNCTSAPGCGADHQTRLYVDGQTSIEASSVVFSYAAPFIIGEVNPKVGHVVGGYRIQIRGTDLGLHRLASIMVDNNIVTHFSEYSHYSATFTMPPSDTAEEVNVSVIVAGQSSFPVPFHFYNLTSITPGFGFSGGGTKVTILGKGFIQMPQDSPGQVYFGPLTTVKSNVEVLNSSSVQFITEFSLLSNLSMVPYLAMDRTNFHPANGSAFFFYSLPDVSKFYPKSGPTSGGTRVYIHAKMFRTGSYEVTFGNSAPVVCTLDESTDEQVLECVAPSSLTNLPQLVELNLTIDTIDASEKTYMNVGVFQYYLPPAVIQISPPLGPISASNETLVTISGTNFVITPDKPRIKVGLNEREVLEVLESTSGTVSFKVTVPRSMYAQTLPIELALNGQQYTDSNVGFRFYDYPEKSVFLKHMLNITVGNYTGEMQNKTIYAISIARALDILPHQIDIVKIVFSSSVSGRRLDTSGSRLKPVQRRFLQETVDNLIVEYTVRTSLISANNISKNMSIIGTNSGTALTSILLSSLSENFDIGAESMSVTYVPHVSTMPVVDSSYPKIGPIRGGTSLLISGDDFLNSSLITCKFSGVQIPSNMSEQANYILRCGTDGTVKDTEICSTGTFISSEQLVCSTPSTLLSTGPVSVSISLNNQQFNEDRKFMFTYYNPPIILGLSEYFMPLSASSILVFGSFFDTSVAQIMYSLDINATLCRDCVNTSATEVLGLQCSTCALQSSRCGDLFCSPDEACTNCPEDCGVCTSQCGDSICSVDETCLNCPTDCLSCNAITNICGDGRCDLGEHCTTCAVDCGNCSYSNYSFACGDGICDAEIENCLSCPFDCADGICDSDETCDSCPADCNICWPEHDQYVYNCSWVNSSLLACPLPTLTMRQTLSIQINIDVEEQDQPVLWTELNDSMSVTYYEPYNVTEILPNTFSWEGGLTLNIFGQNLDFSRRNFKESTCSVGSASSTAYANSWYRKIYVSNPGLEDLINHQVLVEFDTKTPIQAGNLRADCEDIVLREGIEGLPISTQIFAWLDLSTCNQSTTALWIKFPILRAGKSRTFRIVHGSLQKRKQMNPLTSHPHKVFDHFEGFDLIDTMNLVYPPYDDSRVTGSAIDITTSMWASSKTSHGRFADKISRPYIFEATGRVCKDCSHLLYIASEGDSSSLDSDASFLWTSENKTDLLHSTISTCKLGSLETTRRRMSLHVSNSENSSFIAKDSLCGPLQVLNVSQKDADFLFFGGANGVSASFEWIGVRKFTLVEPDVYVGGLQRHVNEFVCQLEATNAATEMALFSDSSSTVNLYQSGLSTLSSWKENNTFAHINRYEDLIVQSVSPNFGFVEGGWYTEVFLSRNVLLEDLSLAILGPSNETLFFYDCVATTENRIVKCKAPSFGTSRGEPPIFSTRASLFTSLNNALQLHRNDVNIEFVPQESCPIVSSTSFEDLIDSVQGMTASIAASKDDHCSDATGSGSRSLVFRSIDVVERFVETSEFDARCGANIRFSIRIGQYDDCELPPSVSAQIVRFEFSPDEGINWYTIKNLESQISDLSSTTLWQTWSFRAPKEAKTSQVKFRWISNLAHTQMAWALDDVEIIASQCSSTTQLIFAGDLAPNCGPVSGNTKVRIEGDFAKAVGVNVICQFGDIAGFIDLVTAIAVTCVSPPNVPGFVNVSVSICGSADAIATTEFFYYEKPQIQKYEPASMPTSGGSVRFILQDGFTMFNTPYAKTRYSTCERSADQPPCTVEYDAVANFISVDQVMSSQPLGSSYYEPGFPFAGSVEDLRFQSVYTWDQLLSAGLRAGDVVTTLKILPTECPDTGIIAKGFRVAALTRDGDPADGWMPIGFLDGLYLSTQSPADIPSTVYGGATGTTVLFSDCVHEESDNMQWLDLILDTPILIEFGKSLILEFAEENDDDFQARAGDDLLLGVAMRHLFSSHTVRWSGSDPGPWPFTNSEFSFTENRILDQRVPAIKLCTNFRCPDIQVVTSSMPDLSEIGTDITQTNFFVGIALNGQQYDYFTFTAFDAMKTLIEVQPPLGPMKGGTSIRIKPGDYVSGESLPVAVFKSSGAIQNRRRLEAVISEEFGVAKYFTPCQKLVVDEEPLFECSSTPSAPEGNYNLHLSLNSLSFDAEGVQYYFYPPMSVTSILPFRGTAFGGDVITVTGIGFMTLSSSLDLISCRFGRSCLTGQADCLADVLQTPYVLNVDEGVELVSKANYVDANTIECPAPARPLGDWEIFVSNNGQDWEPGENSGAVFSLYTSRPCDAGLEAAEYYDKCTICKPGFFEEDPERPNIDGKLTDEVYPIQCAQCPIGKYQEDFGQLQCNDCPVGTTTLAKLSGRIVQIAAASNRENDCTCINKELSLDGDSSFYQDKVSDATLDPGICTWNNGGCCSPCPEGAVCNGGNETIFADDGYWQSITPAGRVLEVFQKCTPASACKRCNLQCMEEKKACADEGTIKGGLALLNATHPICQLECHCDNFRCYQGEACSVCGRGVNIPDGTIGQNFYREDGFCERCPPTDGAMLALMLLAAMIGLYFFALFAQYFRGLGAPRIFSNFMAVTVAFANFDLNWPPEIIAFFRWFSQFYIDIDVVKPECELTLTFFQKWMYTMIIPIFVLTVLFIWYILSQLAMRPFGSAKQKARMRDKDRRSAWIRFNDRGKAWALVQSMRVNNCSLIVCDSLDDVEWSLEPEETAVFRNAARRSIRLWKRREYTSNDGEAPTRQSTQKIILFDLASTRVGKQRLKEVESCRVTGFDVIKKPLYNPVMHIPLSLLQSKKVTKSFLPSMHSQKIKLSFKAPVFRVTRRVRSRAVKIAGVAFNSQNIASHGKLLASIGKSGKVEFSRGFACLFQLDEDVASRRKEFFIDKIKLDVDGPVSTSTSKATLRLRITIFRNKHGEPDWDGEPLADGTVKISAPGVVAVDFSGTAAISHYWHPTYWLVVKPTAAHLVGHDAKAGHWTLRHAKKEAYGGTQLMTSTMGAGAVDAIDMGAYTRTSFVPLQKGIRIQGVSAWGDWKHMRCTTCEIRHQKNRDDPDKWNEVVTCEHQTPFAFGITCVYPDEMEYVAAGDISKQEKIAASIMIRKRSLSDLNSNNSEGNNEGPDIEDNDETGYDSLEDAHSDNDGSVDNNKIVNYDGQKQEESKDFKGMQNSNGPGKTEKTKPGLSSKKSENSTRELEFTHGLKHLESDMGQLGILLAEATIHLGYKNKTSVTMQTFRKRKIRCFTDCKNCCSKCKRNRCGRALAEPFNFSWTLFALIWYFIKFLFWTCFLAVGMIFWVILTLIRSIWAGTQLAFMAKEVAYLKFHTRCCCCCGNWRTSFSGLLIIVILGIFWIFLGDLALQWGLELSAGSLGILWFPYSRMHFLSLLFVVLSFLLILEMKPRQLFDLEQIRTSSNETVTYMTQTEGENLTTSGLVVMKMGPALLIRSQSNLGLDKKAAKTHYHVIHERDVLETGVVVESSKTKSPLSSVSSSSLMNKDSFKTTFETTSGKLSIDLNASSREKWKDWIKERKHAGVQDNEEIMKKQGYLFHFYSNDGWKKEYFTLVDTPSSDSPARLSWFSSNKCSTPLGCLTLDQTATFNKFKMPANHDSKAMVNKVQLQDTAVASGLDGATVLLYGKDKDLITDLDDAKITDAREGLNLGKSKFSFEIKSGPMKILLSASDEINRSEWIERLSSTTNSILAGSHLQNKPQRAITLHRRTADIASVKMRDSTHWTWYDSAFGPHLLRYILTTRSLNEFDAQRNSIHQVQEMHKVHELQGIDKVVEWDIKNSYINAYFIFIMYVHLTLTKTIVSVFICTEQPHSGDLTLDQHPEMICWTSKEHQRVVAWAQFFLLVYSLGLPLFIVYKLREIFRNEREFDPKMRARFGYLYFKYTTTAYLWEIVILGRKVFIAVVRMFTKTPTYFLVQSSGALIVLAVLLVMQILWQPYNEPFLNHMESAALTNHVFVLFIGIMFQSGALGKGDDRILSPFTFALFVMASIMATFFYLIFGIIKELREMGIITMATQGASAIVLENYGRSVQKLRRTARSHWCFRPLGNCCNRSVRERGKLDDDEEHNPLKERKISSQSDGSELDATEENGLKGIKSSTSSEKIPTKKREHHPPPPPRYSPPSLHYDDWLCPSCNFMNLGKEHPYSNTCAQCEKRRPQKKTKLKVTLAQKKRALGLEIDIISNILLSEDAQFAAVNWGIDDHSTTLRETYWLVKALEELTFSIMEVFFNIRQISKQQEMQQKHSSLKKEARSFLAPLTHMFNACCSHNVQNRKDERLRSRGWARRVDPLSKLSYYVHIDRLGDKVKSKVTVSEPGWYAFFDCDLLRLYYAYLGAKSWEHVTWKKPHEKGVIINGSIGEIVTAVSWKQPRVPDAFVKLKIDRLLERLQDFDSLMVKVKSLVGSKVELPEFLSFKEYIAGLLGVPIHGLIATHRNKKEESKDDRASRHFSRLMLTAPTVPVNIDSGQRPLDSIFYGETDSSESSDIEQPDDSSGSSADEQKACDIERISVKEVNKDQEKFQSLDSNLQAQKKNTKKQACKATNKKPHLDTFDYASLFEGIDTIGNLTGFKATSSLSRKTTMGLLLGGESLSEMHKESSDKLKPIERKSTMKILLEGEMKSLENEPKHLVGNNPKAPVSKPSISPDRLSSEQSRYIGNNIDKWRSEYAISSKIPMSMKKYFKKQGLRKQLATQLLLRSDNSLPNPTIALGSTKKASTNDTYESVKNVKELVPQLKMREGTHQAKSSEFASLFTAEQQQFIDRHLDKWKASYASDTKIPKRMKQYFKKQGLKKSLAQKLLVMERGKKDVK